MLNATFLFSGFIDYWGGDGARWEPNKGCLFAHYSTDTTVKDIIDELVDDFNWGGDCDSFPNDVTEDDVRQALIGMLSGQGQADYESGALSEFAKYYAEDNDLEPGAPFDDQANLNTFDEMPVIIVLLTCDVCEECGTDADS